MCRRAGDVPWCFSHVARLEVGGHTASHIAYFFEEAGDEAMCINHINHSSVVNPAEPTKNE